PEPPAPIPAPPEEPSSEERETTPPKWVQTPPNNFGVYKVFPVRPSHDPEDTLGLDDLCGSAGFATATQAADLLADAPAWFPFFNATIARLMAWFHLGSNTKSIADLDALVHDVMLAEDYDPAHLQDFSAARENKRLDDYVSDIVSNPFALREGWKTCSVKITVPAPKMAIKEKDSVEFEVKGFVYRPLLDVMVESFQSPLFNHYHTTPFEQRYDPAYDPSSPNTTQPPPESPLDEHGLPPLPTGHGVFMGEAYTSPRILKAYRELSESELPQPYLETIIAAYMFWSDATQLANFGTASLWPLYTFFGNLSKYIRGKPTANAGYHQAYFPTVFSVSTTFNLPPEFKDFYFKEFGVAPSADVLAHMKRELFHRCWDILLCPDFIHAWLHGLEVRCFDGILRRLFPRFFSYSADYPEKVLIATIKNFGGCPCPRCFVTKDAIHQMGTVHDMQRRKKIRIDSAYRRQIVDTARRWIFEKGYIIGGAGVNRILKPHSLVPTRNAFSVLAKNGLNIFETLLPDVMHEVEIGGWKSLLIHLIRLLHVIDPSAVEKMDERFRRVPTFGKSIRQFRNNVSDMKQMAARDFEDILQVRLVPEPHNTHILDLIHTFATFHAYAKLRLHTTSTIEVFREVTTELGADARTFQEETCAKHTTFELPSEMRKRARDTARKQSRSAGQTAKASTLSRLHKTWNLNTYKWHALGDYPDLVINSGTTDSVSTQIGEVMHRDPKALYRKTNKRGFEVQIATLDTRRRILRRIMERMRNRKVGTPAPPSPQRSDPQKSSNNSRALPDDNDETLPPTSPGEHYYISDSRRTYINLPQFMRTYKDDPAAKNFVLDLKGHLLARLLNLPYDGDEHQFTADELAGVTIEHDRIYTHRLLRVNYTTYDMRRDQDMLNIRTHPDFMALSHEDDAAASGHPYWYGRIVMISHLYVRHIGPRAISPGITQKMDVLWVRWFGSDPDQDLSAKRLYRVGFVPMDESAPDAAAAFGFLDPAQILRAAHIIPAFARGRTDSLLPPSVGRQFDAENDEDYNFYYINRFPDRDMFMRFSPHSIGHRFTRKLTQSIAVAPMDIDEDPSAEPNTQITEILNQEPGPDGEDPEEQDSDLESENANNDSEEDENGADGEEDEFAGEVPTEADILDSLGFAELQRVFLLYHHHPSSSVLSSHFPPPSSRQTTMPPVRTNDDPAPADPHKAKYEEILGRLTRRSGNAQRNNRRPRREPMEHKASYDQLLYAAKFLVRGHNPFLDVGMVLDCGAAEVFKEDRDEEFEVAYVSIFSFQLVSSHLCHSDPDSHAKHVLAFTKMMDSVPKTNLYIVEKFFLSENDGDWAHLIAMFRESAKSARQQDTSSLKPHVNYFVNNGDAISPAVSPGLKTDRGVNHPQLRKYLVPYPVRFQLEADPAHPSLIFSLTTCSVSVIASLIGHTLVIDATEFPSFFYPDNQFDADDLQARLFQGPALPRVGRHIWTQPASALDPTKAISRNSNARAHGVSKVTKEMVAYIAARTIISTSNWDTDDGAFSNIDLFDGIVRLLDDDTDTWVTETLAWYDEYVACSFYLLPTSQSFQPDLWEAQGTRGICAGRVGCSQEISRRSYSRQTRCRGVGCRESRCPQYRYSELINSKRVFFRLLCSLIKVSSRQLLHVCILSFFVARSN
ncbi:GLOBIN domain-containing protein, partial [Favolaschia claudopus]